MRTIKSPLKTALLFGGASLFAMLIAMLINSDLLTIWQISAAPLLMLAVFFSAQGIIAPRFGAYMKEVIFTYISLFIIMGVGASIFSGTMIFDAGHYRTIYVVLLFSFFVMVGMVTLIKSFLSFLEHKDETKGYNKN